VKELLSSRLIEMKKKGDYLDSITFAGNGEPTLHPEFREIMDDTVDIRNRYFPEAKIAVLSNATLAGNFDVYNALLKADLNILKLDSAIETTLRNINCPKGRFGLTALIDSLKKFRGKLIIQTLFFRGTYGGVDVDNCTENEISAWLKSVAELQPQCVMIYSIARDTAIPGLKQVGIEELSAIAARVRKIGIEVQVTP
jgi:wyosine [tRNA(Phe)-imidazoG37] synthetase (radical SAM superfamily)